MHESVSSVAAQPPDPAVAGSARRRVTRADVAAAAGVSTAVVSYTLNGTKNVSDATRARVLAAVRELGYRPNVAARALKTGSTAQLGLIVPTVLNRFFAELVDHAERAAAERGLALVVMSAREGIPPSIAQLVSRQVDGVLVATDVGPNDVAAIEAAGLPTIVLNQGRATDGVPSIGVDRYRGARLAVDHLLEHGHRRIGFIGPADQNEPRHQGWADALADANLSAAPVLTSEFSRSSGYQAGRALAAVPDRLEAVFISSDDQAIGVLLALHEAGVRVPDDVAIVSFDGSQEAAFCWPPLTTVAQPLEEMVSLAVDGVLAPSTAYVELPTELVIRRSCGCLAGR